MTNQEIFDLMDRFQRSSLRSMKLSCQDFSIELEQGAPAAAAAAPAAAPAPAATAAPAPQPESPVISAPLVGTYYAASAPDKPPFVNPGDRVKKGQTLCIVEAMKLMNEIVAETDGQIVEICAQNGQVVDFGCPLFRIK